MKRYKYIFLLFVILLAGWIGRKQDQDKDISFVRDAAAGGLFEVQLGKLAVSKASIGEVKAFGQKMVTDHGKANEELKQLALNKKITLPDSLDATKKSIYDSIALKKARAFDEEYIRQMVKAHDEDVNKFEAASKYLVDADLRAWAAKTLPVLKAHQKHANMVNSKVNGDKKGGKSEAISKNKSHSDHSGHKTKK
jgi:putative membrane protein